MATWGTEIRKAGNLLENAWNNNVRGAGDAFSSIKRRISEVGSYFKNGGTNVVGINVGQIPHMKDVIAQYCTDINKALADLKNYEPSVAFKGTEIVPALENYIDAVKEACGAIVSNMQAFSDQLDLIEKAWAEKDTANADTINKSAESARSEYTAYGSTGSAA